MTKKFANVWDAIENTPEAADEMRARADLMVALTTYIQKHKLPQAQAAQALGVTQPRISDLVRGKIDLFSVDSLMAMLARVGATVQVKIRFKRAA